MKKKTKNILSTIKKAFHELGENDPLRLAGATAFFTTFALPAVLLIILQIAQLVLSEKKSNDELFGKVNKFVGAQSAKHLTRVLEGFEKVAENKLAIVLGSLFMLFVATTLFKVIKNSLNQLWDIRIVAPKSFKLTIKMRFRELIITIAAGILFLVSLLIDGIQTMASDEFLQTSELVRLIFSNAFSLVFSVIIATVWFGLIFCFLPDGRYTTRIGFTGAFVTGILFTLGKLLVKYLLINSNINTIFGNSAAVVLLLLFVFYSSLIFYFGAAFTKSFAAMRGTIIKPLKHAERYETRGK